MEQPKRKKYKKKKKKVENKEKVFERKTNFIATFNAPLSGSRRISLLSPPPVLVSCFFFFVLWLIVNAKQVENSKLRKMGA